MANELVLPNGVDKLSVPQKAVAGGLLAAALYFGAPILFTMMTSLLMVAVIGIPLVFFAYNYQMIWLFFKQISWYFTKWLIGLDVLGYMDRYLEWVGEQEQLLIKSKNSLDKELVSVDSQIKEREESYQKNLSRADAADKAGNTNQRDIAISNAADDQDFIKTLVPVRDEAEQQVTYMAEVTDVFATKRQQLAYTVTAQKSKFKSLRAISNGLRAASSVISGSGNANKLWNETQEQLVSQMNQFTANIHTFNEVVKPAIEAGRFDKQLRQAEGMKLLEQFRGTNFQLKENN